jgi:hypothetical protein
VWGQGKRSDLIIDHFVVDSLEHRPESLVRAAFRY